MKYISLSFFHTRLMVLRVFVSKLFLFVKPTIGKPNQRQENKTFNFLSCAWHGHNGFGSMVYESSGQKIYQTDQIHETDQKAFLLKSKNMFGHDIIVTQASTDILNNNNALLYLAEFRDLCVIYFVSDPRLLLL